jgi:hypothetical protein
MKYNRKSFWACNFEMFELVAFGVEILYFLAFCKASEFGQTLQDKISQQVFLSLPFNFCVSNIWKLNTDNLNPD